MSNSLGEKLKVIAVITFISELILSISLAVKISDAYIFSTYPYSGYSGGISAVIIIGGGVFAFAISSILYGVGEVLERMHYSEHKECEQVYLDMGDDSDELGNAHLTHEHKFRKETEQWDATDLTSEETVVYKNVGDDVVMICPKCQEQLYFDREVSEADCPYCNHHIKLK